MATYEFPYRTSFWCRQQPERLLRQEGATKVDVAVIGGGFAGLSSARCLKEADPSLDVALLESEYIGYGASGRNAGGVSPMPPVPWLIDDLTDPRHCEPVRWAVSYIRQQAQELKTLIEREGIDCDFQRGVITPIAPGNFQKNLLKWVAAQCERVELPCRTVSETELWDGFGYPGKMGISLEGHTLQPYRLARGLLQVAQRMGVRVYESTRVSRIVPSERGVELLTEAGARLFARKVVLATNAYTPQLKFGRRKLFPLPAYTYMLATEPLDEATLKRFGFRGGFTGELNAAMYYVRVYKDRLLFGGGGIYSSKADAAAHLEAAAYQKLYAGMLNRFPFLADVRLKAAWGGLIHETLTDAPVVRVSDESPHVILNFGYSSSGVTLTQFSGKMVAGLVLGKPHIDPEAERLRQMYAASRIPVGKMMKLGWQFLQPSIFNRSGG